MSSDLKVTNIKHESSGSNNLVLASDGNVSITNTLSAGTIGGGVAMASSGVTVRNVVQVPLASQQHLSNSSADTTFFSPTYTPLFSGSKVQGILMIYGQAYRSGSYDARKNLTLNFTGSGITDFSTHSSNTSGNLGVYDYGASGAILRFQYFTGGQLMTTTSTALITCNCKLKNNGTGSNNGWDVYANNTIEQTHFTWIEYK